MTTWEGFGDAPARFPRNLPEVIERAGLRVDSCTEQPAYGNASCASTSTQPSSLRKRLAIPRFASSPTRGAVGEHGTAGRSWSWTRPTTRTSSLSATKDRYRGRPATAIDRPSMARGPVHRGVPHGSAAGLPGSSPASLLDSGPDMSPRAARESGRRCGIDRHRQPARCGMMGRSRR